MNGPVKYLKTSKYARLLVDESTLIDWIKNSGLDTVFGLSVGVKALLSSLILLIIFSFHSSLKFLENYKFHSGMYCLNSRQSR